MDIRSAIEQEDLEYLCELDSSKDFSHAHAKIVALIKCDKYQSALDELERVGSDKMQFERAYCYYRTNKFEKALEICGSQKSERFLHLRAQAVCDSDCSIIDWRSTKKQ
jgi:uncharacterized pyridoxamine 5'-phosphate oxidase family protein